jgi:HlyD family secretion protein
MKPRLILIALIIALPGCSKKSEKAEAYGNFEATEVVVSSETGGKIMKFDIKEGTDIDSGSLIAQVDTTLPHLQKAEIDASMKSVSTRLNSIAAQNNILQQQIANINVNIVRTENMLRDDAATKKQYDDLTGQVAVLQKQIAANNTQTASVLAELSVLKAKKSTLNEQIDRCNVKSPLNGTVIEKYAEAGEITSPGKPLVKIANLSVMKLKVYVSGAQLGKIKTGQECTVRIDNGEKGYSTFTGTVSYISDKAEFTPKIIQTKEERVILVYAVTIEINNDGSMKAGMPGEVIF